MSSIPSAPEKRALHYLSLDPLSHMDMIAPIRRRTADLLYAKEDGVMLYERSSETCMISVQHPETFLPNVDVSAYRLFAVHQTILADQILQQASFPRCMTVCQAVYRSTELLPGTFSSVRLLDKKYLHTISKIYTTMNDSAYLEELLDRHQIWGIFEGSSLAGFIGEHLEGSMGLLEVLPAYRRKGYGRTLEAFLINHTLTCGHTPFCQVEIHNQASLALQRALGLELSSQTTHWLMD